MLEELTALAKIAEIDAQALSADEELEAIPQRLAGLEEDVGRLGRLLEAERQELREADSLLAAQEEEIQGQTQALARSKAKSARARTMREADAVERELEVIRRTTREREQERDKLKEAIGKRRASVEKHEKDFEELQNYAQTEREKADKRLAELNAERDKVLGGREQLVAKVPSQVVRRYETIRKKRSGVGVVAIKAGGCSGCFVQLPPQQVIAVQRGETFEQCPRCHRILFDPKILEPSQEA